MSFYLCKACASSNVLEKDKNLLKWEKIQQKTGYYESKKP